MTTILSTMQDVQTKSIEQLRSAQEQVLTYNEQLAEQVTDAMPSMPAIPVIENIPGPVEVTENFFGFWNDLFEANKDFTLRLLAPWNKADAAAK